MSDYNQERNRAVWFDIPVVDVDRARDFYAAVLGVGVTKMDFNGMAFAVIDHEEGNGGCLVPRPNEVVADKGLLVYLNVEGRIQAAVTETKERGGRILEEVHSIGPHGFRAVIVDSEGNRVALHSMVDA